MGGEVGQEFERVRSRIMEAVKDAVDSVIEEEFASSTSPSGARWATVSRPGLPLVKTGALRTSFRTEISGQSVIASSPSNYSQHHQYGTRRMVSRPMLPTTSTLPPMWYNAIESAIKKALP